jgi:hypothetical protein
MALEVKFQWSSGVSGRVAKRGFQHSADESRGIRQLHGVRWRYVFAKGMPGITSRDLAPFAIELPPVNSARPLKCMHHSRRRAPLKFGHAPDDVSIARPAPPLADVRVDRMGPNV